MGLPRKQFNELRDNSYTFNLFYESMSSSSRTQGQYVYYFCKYMKWSGLTNPDDLISEAEKENNIKVVLNRISSWIIALKRENAKSYNTIATYLNGVLRFYESNNVDLGTLGKKNLKRLLPECRRVVNDRAYTYQEIAKILEFSDYRARVAILLMASAALRIEALVGLKVKHFEEVTEYEDPKNIGRKITINPSLYKIRVYAETNSEYYTFCTPECKKSIDNYLDYRRRCGENVTPQSHLLIQQYDYVIASSKYPCLDICYCSCLLMFCFCYYSCFHQIQ